MKRSRNHRIKWPKGFPLQNDKMAAPLSEQEERDLRFVFSVYDPKNSGVISADDVVRAMSALGFSQSRDVIEVCMAEFSHLLF